MPTTRLLRRFFPKDPELVPFLPGLRFAFFNALTWQVALGTPMVLLAEGLGATSAQAGLAASFVFLLTPVQVLATTMVPRWGYRGLTLAGWSLRSAMLLVPLAIAVAAPFTGPRTWMVPSLIASVFGFCFLRSMGMAASMPWLFAIVPPALRGRYFGSDNLLAGVASIGTLVTSALLFALLPHYPALLLQYLIAAAGSALSVQALRQLPDAPAPAATGLPHILRHMVRMATARSDFRTYLAVTVACHAATTPLAPFIAYHLRADTGMSTGWIMALELVRHGGSTLAAWKIRHRIDARGARPYLLLSLGLYAAVGLAWLFALREFSTVPALIAAYLALGIAATAWVVGNLAFLPKLIPAGDRMAGITLHSVLAPLVGGVTTMLWGAAMKRAEGGTGLDPVVFAWMFAVGLAGCVGAIATLARMRERGPTEDAIPERIPVPVT